MICLIGSGAATVQVEDLDYTVNVVSGPLYVNGKCCASKIRHGQRSIDLDKVIPLRFRWSVVCAAIQIAESDLRRGREPSESSVANPSRFRP